MENSKFFMFDWSEVKSAVVSGLLMALLVVLSKISYTGSIYNLDWSNLLDMGVMAFITSIISLLKSILTTSDGKFIGLVKIK